MLDFLKLIMDVDVESGEQYLIANAKKTQSSDAFASKAWIITAKTLYPNDFGVQVRVSIFLFCLSNIVY